MERDLYRIIVLYERKDTRAICCTSN